MTKNLQMFGTPRRIGTATTYFNGIKRVELVYYGATTRPGKLGQHELAALLGELHYENGMRNLFVGLSMVTWSDINSSEPMILVEPTFSECNKD